MRNRIIGITLGVVIGFAFVAWQGLQRPRGTWNLMPENEGAISALAIQYTRDSSPYSTPCYREFLREIDPNTQIIAVCGDAHEARDFREAVRSWKIERPERVRTVVVGLPITGWCKDRFLVSQSSPTVLIHPSKKETGLALRTHDALVAPALAKARPRRFRAVEVPLEFDAGDILATRRCVIVSDTLWWKNGSPEDFERRLRRMFGRKVIWLRDAPRHHIGMYAAPLDDRTVMVGDPELARPLWTQEIASRLGRADFSEAAVAPFRRAAAQLRKAGFRVIPVPLAVIGPQVWVTYTNGVFETRGRKRIVYMPSYDEPSLDNAARRAYEKAGWQVRPIPVRTVYRFRGTIGCLVNVVERG